MWKKWWCAVGRDEDQVQMSEARFAVHFNYAKRHEKTPTNELFSQQDKYKSDREY